MLVAFFESVKYVGHLFPLAFLRVYLGYLYFTRAMMMHSSDFLSKPLIVETLRSGLELRQAPQWYHEFLRSVVIPHWQIGASVFWTAELLIGLSYIFGFCVRPAALVGIVLSLHFFCLSRGANLDLSKTMISIHVVLAWIGAGRCLGFDYFFYKRRRGIWW